MARPPKLSEAEIQTALAALSQWQQEDNTIIREFHLPNFAAAVGFINAIAVLAETADHHPDLFLHGWNKVRVILSTHDQGGLTELDFALAQKINATYSS